MYKELTRKIRKSLREQWFYHIVVGLLFLIYAAVVIIGNGIFLDDVVKVLGFLFLLTGIGNLIYSFSGIGEREFHWGEIFFWGILEVFSGGLLLSNKLLIAEHNLIQEVSLAIEKVTASKVELQGYLIIFYIGTFLTFRGISHIVTKIYEPEGINHNKTLAVIKRVLILDGFIDFIFGVAVTLSMYLAHSIFHYIVFAYIIVTSILTIIFGLGSKYSLKIESEDEDQTNLKEVKLED
ncbi:hypothetical protein NON08_08565 [Cetobacterium somerae]|uniref:hypothetical protein n=1 Tax=Cetobacterium sp. NK01 TaxID=2993530 RepID=UPI002116C0B8|nr:hypothetical protein [Cetobacterium sp. NK01]MCQ8212573.1 hypothetical protein [Cetobacterium sp. NK01]